MFSRTVEYALRAVLCLGGQAPVPLTARELARRTGVPAAYLSKVLQCLSRARLVHAQRGLHGGYVLARPPEAMTVWDVVQAVRPAPLPGGCLLGGDVGCLDRCPLRRPLAEFTRQIERLFRGACVADILRPPAAGGLGCGEPAAAPGPL
jgi:Rrf2 family protein